MMNVEKARLLWVLLHSWEGSKVSLDQQTFFEKWLDEVKGTIGCATCFKKLEFFIKRWPPDYGEEFYLWGVCLHDYVNRQLGHKLFRPDLTIKPLTAKGIFQ